VPTITIKSHKYLSVLYLRATILGTYSIQYNYIISLYRKCKRALELNLFMVRNSPTNYISQS